MSYKYLHSGQTQKNFEEEEDNTLLRAKQKDSVSNEESGKNRSASSYASKIFDDGKDGDRETEAQSSSVEREKDTLAPPQITQPLSTSPNAGTFEM